MPSLTQYWFHSEFFAGSFNGWNEPVQSARSTSISGIPPFSGADAASAATLVRERPDDELVLDIGVSINANPFALTTLDSFLGQESNRTSPVRAAGIPWGPRVPYFSKDPQRHHSWEMIVRIFFDIHISTPAYCWDLDGTISYYLMFFLDPQGKLKAFVDASGSHLGWKPADVCRSTVQQRLSDGVAGGVPVVQGLVDATIARFAPGRMRQIYLLPGSGTKAAGPFQEDADMDVALVVRPARPNLTEISTVSA